MIVEVFVAQRQTEDPLPQQGFQPVFNEAWIASVGETRRKPSDQTQALIELA
jgi:hypothetical protein